MVFALFALQVMERRGIQIHKSSHSGQISGTVKLFLILSPLLYISHRFTWANCGTNVCEIFPRAAIAISRTRTGTGKGGIPFKFLSSPQGWKFNQPLRFPQFSLWLPMVANSIIDFNFSWINDTEHWIYGDDGLPLLCGNLTGARHCPPGLIYSSPGSHTELTIKCNLSHAFAPQDTRACASARIRITVTPVSIISCGRCWPRSNWSPSITGRMCTIWFVCQCGSPSCPHHSVWLNK